MIFIVESAAKTYTGALTEGRISRARGERFDKSNLRLTLITQDPLSYVTLSRNVNYADGRRVAARSWSPSVREGAYVAKADDEG